MKKILSWEIYNRKKFVENLHIIKQWNLWKFCGSLGGKIKMKFLFEDIVKSNFLCVSIIDWLNTWSFFIFWLIVKKYCFEWKNEFIIMISTNLPTPQQLSRLVRGFIMGNLLFFVMKLIKIAKTKKNYLHSHSRFCWHINLNNKMRT